MQIIAVDTGNRLMKTPHFVFNSGISNLGTADPPIQSKDIIKYNGNNYVLVPVRTPYLKDKTVDDTYYILTLFAIAKELVRLGLTGQKQEIALAVGLPLSHVAQYKKRYRDYFVSNGTEVTYQYNGQQISIDIRNVTVFPQGFPAAADFLEAMDNVPRAYIVDIGGYTTDIIRLSHGEPDLSYFLSLDKGVIEMMNEICDGINRDFGKEQDEAYIEPILRGTIQAPTSEYDKKLYRYVQDGADKYASDLANKLLEKQIDRNSDTLIFVGGGSELFKNVLQKRFDKTFFNTDVHANAIGYAHYASIMLNIPYND